MELSNYQAFMECMRKWEKIGCNILCGLALWEQMQDCDRRGVPYTDIDIEAVSQDVAYRLMMSHDRLYALALYEWTEQHFTQNSDTSDAAAGEEKQGSMDRSGRIVLCIGCWRRHVLFHARDIGPCNPDRNKGTGTAGERRIIFGGGGSASGNEERGTQGSKDSEYDGTLFGGSECG